MMINSYQSYLEKHITKSPLLKCFFVFLEGKYDLISPDEIEKLVEAKRDYKNIAALGFIVSMGYPIPTAFENGLKWLIGCKIDGKDYLLFDNEALLGFIIGITTMKLTYKPYTEWLEKVLMIKTNISDEHASYAKLLRKILYSDIGSFVPKNDLEIELGIFANFRFSETLFIDRSLIADYFNAVRKKVFPYYKLFFQDIIAVFNYDSILHKFILEQECREELIQSERQKISALLNEKIRRRAHLYAKRVLWGFALLSLAWYIYIGTWVWFGDWNFLEPKTFVALGVPLLGYGSSLVYFLITGKELSFAPASIYRQLVDSRKRSLVKMFGIEEQENIRGLNSDPLVLVEKETLALKE